MEPMMVCSRIDKTGKTQLGYPSQPLEIGMFDQIENDLVRYGNKPIDRVVEDFTLVHVETFPGQRSRTFEQM